MNSYRLTLRCAAAREPVEKASSEDLGETDTVMTMSKPDENLTILWNLF